jgi:hypothetical protein
MVRHGGSGHRQFPSDTPSQLPGLQLIAYLDKVQICLGHRPAALIEFAVAGRLGQLP